MKTTMLTREDGLKRRKWYLIDVENQILGDVAVQIANLLRGKQRHDFTPNQDCGDFVIVVNANKIRLSGNKGLKEKWYWHSGYVGGIKYRTGAEMIATKPVQLIRRAVWGMMPKNNALSRALLKKLYVYQGPNHPNQAQNPITYQLG